LLPRDRRSPRLTRARRYVLRGPPHGLGHTGINVNASNAAVVDSYLSDFKNRDMTVQAFAINILDGWGPFKVANNYIEASTVGFFTGGQDISVSNLVPADIEIRGNYFNKPLSWRPGDPSYLGHEWSSFDLLELQAARRVLIDGNVFEHSWPTVDQPAERADGWAIGLTPRNQSGGN